jgi:hypothetical protein
MTTQMSDTMAKAKATAKATGNDELLAEITRLEAENTALRAAAMIRTKVSFKVTTPKEGKGGGAISMYGLGRFPTTLYRSQWEVLLANVENLRKFIDTNKATLDAYEARYAAERDTAQTADAAAALAARVDARLASASA